MIKKNGFDGRKINILQGINNGIKSLNSHESN